MANLFGDDNFPPYQRHSDTSLAAAASVAESAGTKRMRVNAFIAGRFGEGATDEEVQLALHMNPSTERPRRIELTRMCVILDSGRMRRTMSNRFAVVWVHRDFYREAP